MTDWIAEFAAALGLDPNFSYGNMDPAKNPIVVKRDPATGETWVGTHSRRYPGQFPERATEDVDYRNGFASNGPPVVVDTSMVGDIDKLSTWIPPPGAGDDGINWWTPFLTGEGIVAGTLILGPTILDIFAALAGSGKKPNEPLAKGLRHAAETMKDSTAKAMPTIMAGITNPAFAIPFIYLNLEALHKQGLIDSAIAHTLEPMMIGSELIKSIGQSGIIGELAGLLGK